MFKFHDFTTKSLEFKQIENEYKSFLDDFKEYAEELTFKAGDAKKKSGKADSYRRHLVRLLIGYSKNNKNYVKLDLTSSEDFKKINKITYYKGFKEFNKRTGRFYGATLSCLKSYIIYLNSLEEEKIDLLINSDLVRETSSNYQIHKNIKPIDIPPKIISTQGKLIYPRNLEEAFKAKKKAKWQCEFDNNHNTFISLKNNLPFMESHHLIPMAAQGFFDYSIDFSDNIVSLCPNCHQRIHHAVKEDKKIMIDKLFETRNGFYEQYGIMITKKELYSFYNI